MIVDWCIFMFKFVQGLRYNILEIHLDRMLHLSSRVFEEHLEALNAKIRIELPWSIMKQLLAFC